MLATIFTVLTLQAPHARRKSTPGDKGLCACGQTASYFQSYDPDLGATALFAARDTFLSTGLPALGRPVKVKVHETGRRASGKLAEKTAPEKTLHRSATVVLGLLCGW